MILVILIMICILIIYFLKNKYFCKSIENFDENCVFDPWGETNEDCIEICKSVRNDNRKPWNLVDNSNNTINCSEEKCKLICSKCKDYERCQWLNKYNIKKQELEGTKNNQLNQENSLLPEQLTININDDYITWENKNTDNEVMIHYLRTNENAEKVNIIHLSLQEIMNLKSENDIVKFPINLDPAYNYTFFAYSINKYGVSNISNSKTWPQ